VCGVGWITAWYPCLVAPVGSFPSHPLPWCLTGPCGVCAFACLRSVVGPAVAVGLGGGDRGGALAGGRPRHHARRQAGRPGPTYTGRVSGSHRHAPPPQAAHAWAGRLGRQPLVSRRRRRQSCLRYHKSQPASLWTARCSARCLSAASVVLISVCWLVVVRWSCWGSACPTWAIGPSPITSTPCTTYSRGTKRIGTKAKGHTEWDTASLVLFGAPLE
jgi:hypothetical protein